MKTYENDPSSAHMRTFYHCPARLGGEAADAVRDVALRAHNALGCDDFSRVDIRLGEDGIPYVREVNSLPGLSPYDSNLPFIAKSAGMSYNELINTMLGVAMKRWRARLNGGHSERGGRELERRQLQAH